MTVRLTESIYRHGIVLHRFPLSFRTRDLDDYNLYCLTSIPGKSKALRRVKAPPIYSDFATLCR